MEHRFEPNEKDCFREIKKQGSGTVKIMLPRKIGFAKWIKLLFLCVLSKN